MQYENIWFERTVLSTFVFARFADSELSELIKEELNENLFTGERRKIAARINNILRACIPYEVMENILFSNAGSDIKSPFAKEFAEVVSHSPLVSAQSIRLLVKSLKECAVAREFLEKQRKRA